MLPLNTYSLAPVWDDTAPYYGLFVERRDVDDVELGRRFAAEIDRELGVQNIEYAAKRESGRLGAVRVMPLADGYWTAWDQAKLASRGGAAEQYKHPCLIGDPAAAKDLAAQVGSA